MTCDYLVVAGGGAVEVPMLAVAGAGGYRYLTSQQISATAYTVTVGSGGAGYAGGSVRYRFKRRRFNF
jgi:hypothetical protein